MTERSQAEVLFSVEQAVLGHLVASPARIPEVLDRIPPELWRGQHVTLAETLLGMHEAGQEITPTSLLDRLRSSGLLHRVNGATLYDLDRARANPVEVDMLVDSLEAEIQRQRVRAIGIRMVQRSENPTQEPEEIAYDAGEAISSLGARSGAVQTRGWPDEDVEPEPEWIIPGLVAADERVMITGGEGFGKTMLIRQLVASVAVGKHPFTFTDIPVGPVLHVDLENPTSLSDRAYRNIRNRLRSVGVVIPDGTLHRLEPRLFDVADPSDVAWLLRAVRAIQPKLIAIGPLKNMSSEDLNEEKAAVRVQNVLSRIRAETSAALILEAHAGYANRDSDWRPRGSSSFLGWPEFGFGLKPVSPPPRRVAELVKWRMDRPEGRLWPIKMAEGTNWPWVELPPI